MPIFTGTRASQVNVNSAGAQFSPSVASMASDRGYVITWTGPGANPNAPWEGGVYGRRYALDGTPLGGDFLITDNYATGGKYDATVAGLSNGYFTVVWTATDSSDSGVYMRLYSPSGTPLGGEFLVSQVTHTHQLYPDVVALHGGGYLVTWTDAGDRDGDGTAVFVRKFGNDGAPLTGDIMVNTTGYDDQVHSDVTALPDGGFVVAWYNGSDSYYDVYAQRFNAAGEKVGPEVNLTPTGDRSEYKPSVTALNDGGYVVAWQEFVRQEEGEDDLPETLRAQRFDANGNRIGGTIDFTGEVHAMAGLADGGFVIAVGDGVRIVLQRYDAAGQRLGGELPLTGGDAIHQNNPSIALLDDGSFVVTWQEYVLGGEGEIFQARFRDADFLGEGSERAMGTLGADYLEGFGGDDDLYGAAGDDVLDGGAGADRLIGGAGYDEASYIGASGAVTLNLVSGGHGGDAAGDRFESIEQFTLSRFGDRFLGSAGVDTVYGMSGDDSLVGGAGDDHLDGGVGDDLLEGGLGADMLVGAEGVDEVSYLRETAAVIVDLGGRRGSGAAAGDSYQSVERFTLTRFDDTFLGGADADRVAGGAGNDMLSGLGGQDTLDGGIGDDVFDGGAGDDTLTGGAGNDLLNGATGADVMYGGTGNDRYVVDDAGDVVVESGALDGTDRVEASIAYTLGDHVETLFLTGTATMAGTGNALANTIVGNAAGNVIDGGAGADLMEGKAGNDRYIVDNAGDKVLEADGAGNDSVEASVSFSLAGQYIETLRLTGTSAINGTGNGQANSLFGNAAANKLNGGGGDDKLHGGAGKDELTGGAGLDRFVFDSALNGATNVDRILDFNAADDGLYLDRSIFKAVATGALSASTFAAGTAAADAGDRIVYDITSGKIWYDADGSGAGAAVLFASVAAGTALTAADFIAF